MFRKVVTEQYPKFEKLPTAPRFHGRHQLNRWPDGLEKCVGCELCAWACPADAIYVEGAENVDLADGVRAGSAGRALRPRLPDQLPALHPVRALHRGVPDPRADDDQRVRAADSPRADLIYEKSDLLAPLLPGMEQPPHAMRCSATTRASTTAAVRRPGTRHDRTGGRQ